MQASYGGEDAFFISQQGSTTFGVADGVGGWASSGVNPAGTHIALCKLCCCSAAKSRSCLCTATSRDLVIIVALSCSDQVAAEMMRLPSSIAQMLPVRCALLLNVQNRHNVTDLVANRELARCKV